MSLLGLDALGPFKESVARIRHLAANAIASMDHEALAGRRRIAGFWPEPESGPSHPSCRSGEGRLCRLGLLIAVSLVTVVNGGCATIPQPLGYEEVTDAAIERADKFAAGQEPVSGPIDLHEAMARALKFNLDHHIEIQQRALRLKELDLSSYQMLPQLVANSGFARRDSFPASRSIGIDPVTGQPSGQEALGFNASQERQTRTSDLTFSWHVLDFGLSYVRARQAADRALIAEEVRRKTINRIIEDVRTAFWRAASADRLIRRLGKLQARASKALKNSRSMAAEGQSSLLASLTYQRELIEIRKRVEDLERELSVAKIQLAALINLPPGTQFEIEEAASKPAKLEIPGDPDALVWSAFVNRPELREITYQQRINHGEARAALLELLPGLQLYSGLNVDSNPFLLQGDWVSWGAKASWNLMKLAHYPARDSVIEAERDILEQRELAMTLAVMTQVHVARIRFFQNRRRHVTAGEYLEVQRRIVENLRAEFSSGRTSEQSMIREEMNLLLAEVGRDLAYAELQNSYANVFASIGLDPPGTDVDLNADLDLLANTIRKGWGGSFTPLDRQLMASAK